MDDTEFFSTETITVPIGFRLFAIVSITKQSEITWLSGTVA